jgi:hypothetical protein
LTQGSFVLCLPSFPYRLSFILFRTPPVCDGDLTPGDAAHWDEKADLPRSTLSIEGLQMIDGLF